MNENHVLLGLTIFCAAPGCGSSHPNATTDAMVDARDARADSVDSADSTGDESPDVAPPVCTSDDESSLPGVRILFPEQPCTFRLSEAAAGISLRYQIMIASDVADVVRQPQDAGHCGVAGPSGLIAFERLEGGGQRYCLCDVGLCPPPPGVPIQLRTGVHDEDFGWRGRNWDGPSDTGNLEGDPFPTGSYLLTVSAIGSAGGNPYRVAGTFTVNIVP